MTVIKNIVKYALMGVGGLFIFSILMGILFGEDPPAAITQPVATANTVAPTTTTTTTTTPKVEPGIGEDDGQMSGRMYGWIESVGYGEASDLDSPERGYKWVVIGFVVENRGTKDDSIASMLGFDLRSARGERFDQAIFADDLGSLAGTILPGKRLVGSVTFEVPEDVTEFELYWSAGLFDGLVYWAFELPKEG